MVLITHTRRACHGVVLTATRLAAPEPASARPTDRGRRGCGVTHGPRPGRGATGAAGLAARRACRPRAVSGVRRGPCLWLRVGRPRGGRGPRVPEVRERRASRARVAHGTPGRAGRRDGAPRGRTRDERPRGHRQPRPRCRRAPGGGTGRTEGLRFRAGGRGAFVRYLPAMACYRFRVAFWPVQSSHRVTDTST